MKATKLVEYLFDFIDLYGDCEVDVITETENSQVEQPASGVSYSPREKRIKIVPEGF